MSLEFVGRQLATAVDHPPPCAGWIHEVKHDGYRTLLVIERRKARSYTRNDFDRTDRYPSITKAAARLGCRSGYHRGRGRGLTNSRDIQSIYQRPGKLRL